LVSHLGITKRIFNDKEIYVLCVIKESYKKGCAEIIFTKPEAAVLKILLSNQKQKKSITELAKECDQHYTTTSKHLYSMKAKGAVESEQIGKKIVWWFNP